MTEAPQKPTKEAKHISKERHPKEDDTKEEKPKRSRLKLKTPETDQ